MSALSPRGEWRTFAAALGCLGAVACGESPDAPAAASSSGPVLSADARLQTAEVLKQDLAAKRHPSDGGGRAWIEAPSATGTRPQLVAGSRARIDLVYEAGPLGIADGGILFLQISPFWGWDTPQTTHPDSRGYTEVTTEAAGIELEPTTADQQLLAIEIRGRALGPGEQVRISYGAGPAGARVDRYAERRTAIWFAVDGDGDGLRALLPDPPELDLLPGPPALLELTISSEVSPGDPIVLVAAVTDSSANAHPEVRGELVLEVPDGLELSERTPLGPESRGLLRLTGTARRDGIYRVRGELRRPEEDGPSFVATSNPLVVRPDAKKLLWGDLHGHSNLSDGTGTPEDYLAYARDVAALDVVALTDHDHWGMEFLDAHPELWERIQTATRDAHAPPNFITILGYEWTSWLHGHRHVLYFEDGGEIHSSLDSDTETPAQLWKALRGQRALTFAHHSAGGPISTNWSYAPDPILEPVTEIVSTHGSSEAMDSPGLIYSPVAGNTVRDALDHGYRLGFIGSGDSHDGHPGLAHRMSPGGTGGLAAIRADERSRSGVLEALRSRRVYATNGPRIWLRTHLDGAPMGSTVPADSERAREQTLDFEIFGTAPIERLDVVRSGSVAQSYPGEERLDWRARIEMPALEAGEYVYLRVVQVDGGSAWSSPIWAD